MFLQSSQTFTPIHGEGGVLESFKSINFILSKLELCPEVQEQINRLIDKYSKPGRWVIEVQEIQNSANNWIATLFPQFGNYFFIDPYPGTFKEVFFFSGGKSNFDDKLWELLPRIVKKEIHTGTRCLFIRAWTPAVMIICRAAEFMVRRLYIWKEFQTPPNSWGRIITVLRSHNYRTETLLDYMNHLKAIRNAVEHPEVVYD